ncbi:MAG: hypothetical protein HQL94_02790 [Magnetococcales bacterium]|nr:hypothetical protein [Magnetococcales bacterium]MBF0438802.1 hypothetical protein [Magnetococcales bacterium]
MIKFLRGLLVGLGFGGALFYSSMLSGELYLASLALMVLMGVLIPLEQQDRRMELLLSAVRSLEERVETLKLRPQEEEEEEEEEEFSHGLFMAENDQDRFMPAIQSNVEGRTVMAQGRRTVERSVEDVARKLSSMQRGE